MGIQFHGHQREITDSLRARSAEGIQKLIEHLGRAVDAHVWVDEDGVKKTVELVLRAPHYDNLVAKGEAKYHEPALAGAIAKLDAQIRRLKTAKKKQVRQSELRA
ncbi:MAG: HPF/RaiA family ribosome-associated protein [Gemmatimonadaceae bacterium]